MKKCNKCKLKFPIEDFMVKKGSPDGHNTICKTCHNAHRREKYNEMDILDPLIKMKKHRSAITHESRTSDMSLTVISCPNNEWRNESRLTMEDINNLLKLGYATPGMIIKNYFGDIYRIVGEEEHTQTMDKI